MNQHPEQVPLQFFKALASKKYDLVWALLTERSQDMFASLYARTSQQDDVEKIKAAFAQNSKFSKTYWNAFAENFQLNTWLSQSYQVVGKTKQQVMVRSTPANVQLLVLNENGHWKFGYIETFMDNR